ncbi:hypothetical protein [Massilibacteroides sp.]|uniref:glutaredoxin family protein n=1 Tax=Massilibacteroides sp. TaxID=2034766 RepID=UPI002620D6A7|nr:hypothetical protein [Massilibacteroides sp.]MDD4516353.1 hypothetical protein [Massilibacteroides sp.]
MNLVTIYTQKNCPKCDVLKKKMEQKGIKFKEETDLPTLVALGVVYTPMLKINEVTPLLSFADARKWVDCEGEKIANS